jgi:hypothetical protein
MQAWVTSLLLVLALAGCAHRRETELHRMQREVQNCILSGGTARLGPDSTILCE